MAKKTVKLTGLDKVSDGLNKAIKDIEGRTLAGLITSSIIIRRHMAKNSPKVPVDTRNLEASWFSVTAKGEKDVTQAKFTGKKAGTMGAQHTMVVGEAKAQAMSDRYPSLYLGFSANYAWWVHENVGAKFTRPGAGAKFLEAALNANKDIILNEIKKRARV